MSVKKITRNGKVKELTMICDSEGNVRMPKFESVSVSTKTFIAITNLSIDKDNFFQYMPITDYTVVKKRRGRKKKIQPEDPNLHVPPGSIISIKLRKKVRGVILKQKKDQKKKFFRHSVIIVMVLEGGKQINAKVSKPGRFQMTGCQNETHHIDFIKYIYQKMKKAQEWTGKQIFTYNSLDEDGNVKIPNNTTNYIGKGESGKTHSLSPIISPNPNSCLFTIYRNVMKNIDFNLGFKIRRDVLDKYINKYTEYCSIFEGSMGTGVNIKVRNDNPHEHQLQSIYIGEDNKVNEFFFPYREYLDKLTDDAKQDEFKKTEDCFHTFLIFASGSVIMSSQGPEMPTVFNQLITTLVENRTVYEEP